MYGQLPACLPLAHKLSTTNRAHPEHIDAPASWLHIFVYVQLQLTKNHLAVNVRGTRCRRPHGWYACNTRHCCRVQKANKRKFGLAIFKHNITTTTKKTIGPIFFCTKLIIRRKNVNFPNLTKVHTRNSLESFGPARPLSNSPTENKIKQNIRSKIKELVVVVVGKIV